MNDLIPIGAMQKIGINEDDVRSLHQSFDRAGTKTLRIHLWNGRTLVWKESPEGIRNHQALSVPEWSTLEERSAIIKRLYTDDKLTQVEIAQALGISQKTVSNSLRKLGIRKS